MKLIDLISTATTNLFRSRLRTFLTILAVLIGTYTLAMTTAIGEGVKQYIDQQTKAFAQPDSIYITAENALGGGFSTGGVEEYDPEKKLQAAAGQFSYLNLRDLEVVRQIPELLEVRPYVNSTPEYVQRTADDTKYVGGVEPFFDGMDLSLAAGELITEDDTNRILLPYQYLEPFGFENPEAALGETVFLTYVRQPTRPDEAPVSRTEELTISGVLINSLFGQSFYLGATLNQDLYVFQKGSADEFLAMVASTKEGTTEEEYAAIKKTLVEKGYAGITYEDQINTLKSGIEIAQIVMGFFAAIALLAATIGIVNTLLMAVLERTKEIGLMKSLGMQSRGIFAIFTLESMSIGFWGGVIGVVIALITGSIANTVLSQGLLSNLEGFTLLSFPPEMMLLIVALAMVVGLIAGALPALRASRLDPIEALRHE